MFFEVTLQIARSLPQVQLRHIHAGRQAEQPVDGGGDHRDGNGCLRTESAFLNIKQDFLGGHVAGVDDGKADILTVQSQPQRLHRAP